VDTYQAGGGKEKEIVKVVHEMDVEEDMLNGPGNLHGGCAGFLIDNCSSMVLFASKDPRDPTGKSYRRSGDLSLSINFTLHAPARLGSHLKIISTSQAMGGRISTIRCEIWDTTHDRLVASGIHTKMAPVQRNGALIPPEARL